MDLVKVKCPDCGASIEINSKLDTVACNYCGTSFVVNKTSQIEKTLKTLDDHIERKNKLKTDYFEKINKIREDEIKRGNEALEQQLKMINDNKWFIILIFGGFAFLFIILLLMNIFT